MVITVTKAPIRLAKVVFKDGYQLVVGGRLVLSMRNGTRQPFPELPVYTPADFPGSFTGWSDGEDQSVDVQMAIKPNGRLRPVSSVRACMTLFVPHDASAVRAWIRRSG